MTTMSDLHRARDNRDAGIARGRAVMEAQASFLLRAIDDWAARVYRGSAPLEGSDPELSRAVNRWGLLRLRAEIRRAIGREMASSGLAEVLALAEAGFWQRIDKLRSDGATENDGGFH